MIEIEGEHLLATLFAGGRESVDYGDLCNFRYMLEQEMPGIYVDTSSDAIDCVVERRPDLFEWHEDGIILSSNPYAKEYCSLKHMSWILSRRLSDEKTKKFMTLAKKKPNE